MRIKEVTHERVRNLGNFESVRVSLTATVGVDDDPREVLAALKSEAQSFLYPNKRDSVKHDSKATDPEDMPY